MIIVHMLRSVDLIKKIPGYEVRRLEELSSEEIYERMKEVF